MGDKNTKHFWICLPHGDDGSLNSCRKSTADGEHQTEELDDQVLDTERAVHDDSIEERDDFRNSRARPRRMDVLCNREIAQICR